MCDLDFATVGSFLLCSHKCTFWQHARLSNLCLISSPFKTSRLSLGLGLVHMQTKKRMNHSSSVQIRN
eukprot:jgi/Bigna1/64779/fgenesh1_kg.84_\